MNQTVIAEGVHALFSASGYDGWGQCAPKLAVSRGVLDTPSRYAAEGTVAHEIGATCLKDEFDAAYFIGRTFTADGFDFVVDQDMADAVQIYVDAIRQRIADFYTRGAVNVTLLVEVRVDYSRYIGQPDSFGTSDVVLLVEWPNDVFQIDVNDLKFGKGVPVYASYVAEAAVCDEVGNVVTPTVRRGNGQMMLYALGALDQYSLIGEATLFSMAIHQPRIYHYDEYECDLGELMTFADEAKAAAERAMIWIATDPGNKDWVIPIAAFTPGEKQCRWCRVGGSCKARTVKNLQTIAGDFDDLDAIANDKPYPGLIEGVKTNVALSTKTVKFVSAPHLNALWPSLDEIDNWTKAVRGEIEKRALAGEMFTTCKLARGRKGNRGFSDASEAERVMKSFRLKTDQMYTYSLIGVPAAEKLLKDQPKRWAKLLPLIGQAEGKISVVDFGDKREAIVITPAADDFEVLDDTGDLA